MKKVILATGYYDTQSERVCLLREGDIVTVNADLVNAPAPCKSKEGQGKWCISPKGETCFVENENLVSV